MAERKTFLFFCGWAEALADFTPQDRCAIYDAVIAYVEDGTLPTLNPVQAIAFKFIKKDIDEMQTKYDAICEKRREYARRGGLAKAAKSYQKEAKGSISQQELPNATYHEHEHEHKHEQEFSDENINKEKEKREKKSAMRFTPPTIDDVRAYAQEKGYVIDSERFISYYESNGWRVGKNPMKDWRATVRTWASRDRAQNPVQGAQILGVGEFINSKGIRTYGTSGQRVPQEAPPRPSEAHYWSETSNRWEKTI